MGLLISTTLQEIYERGGGLTSNSTGGALVIGGDQNITVGGSATLALSSNGSSYDLNAGAIALTTTAQTIIEAINEVDAGGGGGSNLAATLTAGNDSGGTAINFTNTNGLTSDAGVEIDITAGSGASSGDAGGNLDFNGGSGNVAGDSVGGGLVLRGGRSYGTEAAGNIDIFGGDPHGAGAGAEGGSITLRGGSSTGVSTNSAGGSIFLLAGGGAATIGVGGSVTITAGQGTGGSAAGGVGIISGNGLVASDSGDIVINVGSVVSGTLGDIDIGTIGATAVNVATFAGQTVSLGTGGTGSTLALGSTANTSTTLIGGSVTISSLGTMGINGDASSVWDIRNTVTSTALKLDFDVINTGATSGDSTLEQVISSTNGTATWRVDVGDTIEINTTSASSTINIGTDAVATAIAVGSQTGASSLALQAGTGGFDIDVGAGASDWNFLGGLTIDTRGNSNFSSLNTTAATNITQTIGVANSGATSGDANLNLSASSSNGTGKVTITSQDLDINCTGAITIDSPGTGTIGIGTTFNTQAITIGNGANSTTVSIIAGNASNLSLRALGVATNYNQTSETTITGYADGAAPRTISSIIGALNNADHIVGWKEDVDLTTATGGSPVVMFTVPTDKKLIVTAAYALIKTVTGYSGNPSISFSFSGGGDAINSETLIAVSAVDDLWTFLTTGNRHAGTAAETLRYGVDTASISTTLTADLVVCGILVDA